MHPSRLVRAPYELFLVLSMTEQQIAAVDIAAVFSFPRSSPPPDDSSRAAHFALASRDRRSAKYPRTVRRTAHPRDNRVRTGNRSGSHPAGDHRNAIGLVKHIGRADIHQMSHDVQRWASITSSFAAARHWLTAKRRTGRSHDPSSRPPEVM